MIEYKNKKEIKKRMKEIQDTLSHSEQWKLLEKAEEILRQKKEMETDHFCVFCNKKLEPALPQHVGSSFQPSGGGEVFFEFCFGSAKFDLNMCGTKYMGHTCDDCAEKFVPKMKDISET